MKRKKSKLSPMHTGLHCFYSIKQQDAVLYCLHDRAEITKRTIVIELHNRNMYNYVQVDLDDLIDLVDRINKITSGSTGFYSHLIAIQKVKWYYRDIISDWRAEGSWAPLFAQEHGSVPSDHELLETAFRMIYPQGGLCDTEEEEKRTATYLRHLFETEQRMYKGEPVLVDVIDTRETPSKSENFFLRSLRVTCIAYENGKIQENLQWRLSVVSQKFRVTQNKAEESNKVVLNLSNEELHDVLYNCHKALGLLD